MPTTLAATDKSVKRQKLISGTCKHTKQPPVHNRQLTAVAMATLLISCGNKSADPTGSTRSGLGCGWYHRLCWLCCRTPLALQRGETKSLVVLPSRHITAPCAVLVKPRAHFNPLPAATITPCPFSVASALPTFALADATTEHSEHCWQGKPIQTDRLSCCHHAQHFRLAWHLHALARIDQPSQPTVSACAGQVCRTQCCQASGCTAYHGQSQLSMQAVLHHALNCLATNTHEHCENHSSHTPT